MADIHTLGQIRDLVENLIAEWKAEMPRLDDKEKFRHWGRISAAEIIKDKVTELLDQVDREYAAWYQSMGYLDD